VTQAAAELGLATGQDGTPGPYDLRSPYGQLKVGQEAMDQLSEQKVREQISALIAASADDLEEIERILTDGYAQALVLEAEKWRLEKRMGEVAQELQRGDTTKKVRELSTLAKQVDANAGALAELRSLLADLRRHADTVRLASAVR
jgi:signal transduction histidine kinase